jgi:hypothetical protein
MASAAISSKITPPTSCAIRMIRGESRNDSFVSAGSAGRLNADAADLELIAPAGSKPTAPLARDSRRFSSASGRVCRRARRIAPPPTGASGASRG